MPPSPTTQEMGDRHEVHLAGVFGGTKTRASGSQWSDQGDVRNDHDDPFAFCVDGKSTLGKQVAVTRDMIAKIREQAQGEIPALGLRWYGNANLDDVDEDWVAVPGGDWEEVLASARAWAEISSCIDGMTTDNIQEYLKERGEERDAAEQAHKTDRAVIANLRAALAQAHQDLMDAGERIAAKNLELETLRSGQLPQPQQQQAVPLELLQLVPRLPWTVIRISPAGDRRGSAGDPAGTVVYYQADGTLQRSVANTVRIQRSMENRPQVFEDNVRIRNCDVYGADGRLLARCCADDSSIEVG